MQLGIAAVCQLVEMHDGDDAFLISLNFRRQVALRWARQLGIAAVTRTEKVARMHF
jgi:hypothetical protein